MTCIKLFDVTENEEAYSADPQYTAGECVYYFRI
jgi:hypothetical protein